MDNGKPQMEDGPIPQPEDSPQQKMIPHAVTFLAPEGFAPVTYYQVAMSKDKKFFVNAPFNEPDLVLLLQAQGVFMASRNIAKHFQQPQEQSRIWTPPGMNRGLA